MVGASLAYLDSGRLMLDALLATSFGAILIQAGTNLHNDAADHDAGADRPGRRLGPPRVTSQGWLTSQEVRHGAAVCFILAFCVGCYLVAIGGWPIVAIGVSSLLAALAYSGGPWRISHSSLGELFVLAFFGLAAVGGTYYLQTGDITLRAILAGIYVGAPASAVLTVNNHRDREEDTRAGRRTLSIVVGKKATKAVYVALLAIPFVVLPVLGDGGEFWWWLPMLALPWALTLARHFCTARAGAGFNAVLARTASLQLVLGIALAAAWLLPLRLA